MMRDPLFSEALDDLAKAVSGVAPAEIEAFVQTIAAARRIAVFGCGREALQIRGFAMRLFHLGLSASVVGDMTTPAIGAGDVLVVTAGPGSLPSVLTIAQVAKAAGARVLTLTAVPSGSVPALSDLVLTIPAQTMATDRDSPSSGLPMGSVFEGALFLVFEVMVQKLKHRLAVSDEVMRANHTNLE